MTPRQKKFLAEYVKNGVGTQAALAAGYSKHTAKNQAARLLSKEEIRQEIERRTAKAGVSIDRTLSEFAAMGYSNVGEFFDESGRIKKLSELPEALQRSLVGVDVDEEGRPSKLRLGKIAGLEAIARHLNMFPHDTAVIAPFQINIHMDLRDDNNE